MLAEAATQHKHTSAQILVASRRDLIQRIVSSPQFAKSQRLSEFLKYVCSLAEKERFGDINEQSVGIAVFGRHRNYDPAIDSIVRSHASRLRHRLREYFEQDGARESLILTIPRGSYIPHFELRSVTDHDLHRGQQQVAEDAVEPLTEVAAHEVMDNTVTTSIDDEHMVFGVADEREASQKKTFVLLKIALAAMTLIAVGLSVELATREMRIAKPRNLSNASQHPLWRQFAASPAADTLVVSSDSGLVMLQHMTTRPVSLSSYVSGDYLKDVSSGSVPEGIVRKFGSRRYTPAVDLFALSRISRLFGDRLEHLSFRYARDLRLADLKEGNAILLGTSESDPWVQLFEPSMNFYFKDDLANDRAQMINRQPLKGEATHYDSSPQDAAPTIYGVVAYKPNLNGSGNVLILEGQTMAGTQTAADFVFDDSYLLPFLKRIQKENGSLPHFEVLLRSSSFGGQSSRIEVIAYRTQHD